VTTNLPTSPASERNKQPILDVLLTVLPATGHVLEIASGTGQHVCHFAERLPGLRWQPSDPDVPSCETIAARIAASGLANIEPPLVLDVRTPVWPVRASYDALVCINMIHISPWAATPALFTGGARHLVTAAPLVLYGPYLEDGTAVPSNLDFDASLKKRNAEWGLRELADVTRVATEHGFRREQVVRMPANNLTVVFRKTSGQKL
jgi:cyclopropane fatty-acyl-phospholipid synthase-like methyltransferase